MLKLKYSLNLSRNNAPWIASFIGAAIALWVVLMAQGIINRDGALYMRVAALFLEGYWAEGMRLYNWPFYPLLIAAIHKVTGLSLQNSGHALALLFYSASSGLFVFILREAGANRNTLLAGMALWFSSPYLVGDIVPMIVREHGFWMFLLGGLACLLRFAQSHQLRYALGWGTSALLATLFRIEGIIFFILLPFAFLFYHEWDWKARARHVLQAHIILVLAGLSVAVLLFFHPAISLESLGRLHEPLTYLENIYRDISKNLDRKSEVYATQVLGEYLDNFSKAGLILTLLWAFILKISGTAGLLQTALLLNLVKRDRPLPASSALPILAAFALIGIANAAYILFGKFLLPGRMTSPIAFSIMIFSSFALAKLYEDWIRNRQRKRLLGALVIVALSTQLIASLWPPSSKIGYEVRATRWVGEHKKPNEKVFYDHPRMYYYAGEHFSSLNRDLGWADIAAIFENHTIRNYAYFVMHSNKRSLSEETFVTARLGPPAIRFKNDRGHAILIYRVPSSIKDTP